MAGSVMYCGEKGIRTPGPVTRTTVFETAPFDHSGISPGIGSNLLLQPHPPFGGESRGEGGMPQI